MKNKTLQESEMEKSILNNTKRCYLKTAGACGSNAVLLLFDIRGALEGRGVLLGQVQLMGGLKLFCIVCCD